MEDSFELEQVKIMSLGGSHAKTTSKRMNALKSLFWDYEWDSVKKNMKSPHVVARILELATPQQFMIYASLVGNPVIKQFLINKGQRLLSPLSFNFWMLYYQYNETTNTP